MSLAYDNGRFVEKDTITIGLNDFGFSRGLAFFETMRVYGGVPFRLPDHLERMQQGAAELGLALPVALKDVEAAVRHLCGQNKLPHSLIKFYFTAGVAKKAPYSFAGEHDFAPRLIIVEDAMKPDHPEAPYGLEFYKRGQTLKTVPHERVLPRVKSISYLQAYYAAREAGPAWDDILFTHRDGYITEATRANFFCVINGVLCTPGDNILDGVTRKVILEMADEMKMPVALRRLTPADLTQATEAFTSGSPIEMVPVRQINDHILLTTMEGPVFSRLRKAFTEKIQAIARETLSS